MILLVGLITSVLRQILLELKGLLSGAFSTSINGIVNSIPDGLRDVIDLSFLTDTTSILGVSIPTFLIYVWLLDN